MVVHPPPQLNVYNLPWPTDWAEVFGTSGQDRPLIVEIGFGMGHMLRYLSRRSPGANIAGLEISNMCMEKVERALMRGELPNVRLVFGRAETALHHLFEPASLSEVHIHFPDPWFKARHERRRLMQRDTLDVLVNRLKPGALLYLATDIVEYAEMSAALLAATPALENCHATPWVTQPTDRVTTKYERQAVAAGRTCHYFTYRRNDQPAPAVPVIREVEMPHIVLETPLTLEEIQARFAPHTYSEGERSVNYITSYRSETALLFEVYIHEPTIDQHNALILVRGEQANSYTLRMAPLGSPRPTEGYHVAVRHLGEWLVSLSPSARVTQYKVRPAPAGNT